MSIVSKVASIRARPTNDPRRRTARPADADRGGGAEFDWTADYWPRDGGFWLPAHSCQEAYTGSLDAAKALHEAVLPGWFWSVDAQGEAEVALVNQSNGLWRVRHSFSDVVDDNPARSWLIAILKALIAQENDA